MSDTNIREQLERRLGRVHARQRLGIEHDHEEHVFGQGLNFFHLENWYSIHGLLRGGLRLAGLYGRGRRNTERIEVRRNPVVLQNLPQAFHGFTILQLSDLHVDMNPGPMSRLAELLPDLQYDICVITGDFRGRTYGPFEESLHGMAPVMAALRGPVYGILGNHDTIRMLPGLEAMGIRMLLNECEVLTRAGEHLYLAGIDDAHYYRADNIEKAAAAIPHGHSCAILLSHTPEIYKRAAHSEFSLMLSGHTHGGQICLPGAVPLMLDASLPRHMGAGPWRYHQMQGYTAVGTGSSVVAVRYNCPPEITLHELRAPATTQ